MKERPAGPKRLGAEIPRVFTPPLRPLTPETTLGFALIEFASVVLGVELLPWQRWLAIHALELLPDGTFRFRTVLLLVARQNGKSTFLQVLALFFLYVRGVALVIGTAQNLDIAEEVWQGAVDIAQDVPELAAEIERINMTNGKKALELRRGERYKVQAANRRGGRGLSGDLVLMDELREHQSWDAWGAVTKTTMARVFAQIWAASNAGDSASVVLRFLRGLAHLELGDPDGLHGAQASAPDVDDLVDDESLGIFEWSAPPACDLDDRDGWAQANPSLGHTITERAVASARRTDPEQVFRTEVLCQWVAAYTESVIDLDLWAAMSDPDSTLVEPVAFAVDVAPDRSSASIGVAGLRADGRQHVEVVQTGAGTSWVVPRLVDLIALWKPVATVIDPGSPAGSLLPALAEAGVDVTLSSTREVGQAFGAFVDAVNDGEVRHLGQPKLTDALAGAKKRPLGEAWAWDRKSHATDITPLVAVTLALWGFSTKQSAIFDVAEAVW